MNDPKSLLLAQIASARAHLWMQLLGVSRGTLTTVIIADGKTAKDILDHLAAWDQLFGTRVRSILAGRAEDLEHIPDRDAFKTWVFQERHDWPLERSIEALQAGRAECLAVATVVPWDDMIREHVTPAGDRPLIWELAEGRAVHDAQHIAQIQAWREQACLQPMPGPKSVLIAALEAGRAALLAWGRLIPPDAQCSRPVCGQWCWRDVLGHLADWEAWYVGGIRDMVAGRLGGRDFDGDEERWNQAHARARAQQSAGEALASLVRAREELMDLLAGFDDRRLAGRCESPYGDMPCFYDWYAGVVTHEWDHVDCLRQVLGSQATA
jgi:hypothetical protein